VNGQVMNYTTTSCNNMFVTSQYPTNFTSLGTSQVWDCVGGVVTSATDANGKITQSKFLVNSASDPFYRPLENIDQLGNVTSFEYTPISVESTLLFNGGQSAIETLSTLDSTGRAVISQLHQAPGTTDSGNWDTKSRSFDSDGRQYQTSLTCVTTAGTGCSASTETQTYEALSRPRVHHGTGGDIVTKTYVVNDVLSVLSPPPSGENTKAVQKEYDGLGRLKSSCLISTASGSGPCNQANGGTGFLTQYFYDAAGRLLQTIENAQVSSPRQARTYTYDLLGRVVTENNPESATTTYFWDAAPPICYNNVGWSTPGDLGAKLDANGVYTCYGYDGLHRLQGYLHKPSSGCGGFIYDTSTPPANSGITVQNTLGRMVEAYTNNDCNGTQNVVTDKWFSYSPRGEVTDIYESTPNSGGYYHLTKSYWPDGSVASLGGIPGAPTLYYGASDGSGLDGEGRVTKVTASSGVNPVTAVTYTNSGNSQPIGSLTQVTYGATSGAGDSDSFSYDLNTSRMNQYTFTVNGQSVIGKPTWNANGTLQQLQITQDPFNPSNVQTCKYLYDDFVRVGGKDANGYSVDCGAAWQQLFTYDQFGNITKTGSSSWACAICYDQTTNHYNKTLSNNIAYDLDGNLTNDSIHAYQWDANGHMTTNDSSTFTYDAQGDMLEASWGDQYLYDTNGTLLAGSHAQAPAYFTHLPLPGGATAVYAGGVLTTYQHSDWMGSVRFASTPGHAESYDLAFAPFGEPYASTHTGNIFAGMTQVIAADEYETPNREYNTTQGRWISPDPTRGSGNKYVYADNNPLSKVDPYGLSTVAVEIEGLDVGTTTLDEPDDMQLLLTESHPPTSVQTPAQPTQPVEGQSQSTPTAQHQQQEQAAQAQQQGQQQDQHCGFFCKLGNWLGGSGFKTDAEVTEDRRQWLLNQATNDADKNKIRHASADKVNATFECLQSSSCSAQFQAYVQALAGAVLGTANQIANGHAWAKHQGEFPGWSQGDFEGAIKETMQGPDEMKSLSNGRTAYWNSKQNMVVIEDPANVDSGTAFRPTNGKAYFDGLR
jgi:RHS repeat-associated protein